MGYPLGIRDEQFVFLGAVQRHDSAGPAAAGLGLAHAFRSIQGDSWQFWK